MPSTRPCAAFEPLPPDFNVKALVESTPNFEFAVRIHSDMIMHHGHDNFERLVLTHVILGGKPLVVEGYEAKLDRWIFALQWLRDNTGAKVENARDLTKQTNVPLSIGHYLKHMALLTNQWNAYNYKDPDRQRMYLKDIDCPDMWHEKLREHIPPALFYLNESTGDLGGLGASDELDAMGSTDASKRRGTAKAGDLMSSLPKEMRAENLMCYIGHEGTYTPAHREMCASLGQNIMIEASTGAVEDGERTKPGSSIWFMTEYKERDIVSEYWLSKLGHDIEVEKHFAQVNAWKNAPFKTYVVEQKPGDFILIPPLSPHQVWNRGTRTMKIAWNRTTVETLEMAMNEALPKARMVCRDEQYKNKAIVFYTLQKYSKLLSQAEKAKQRHSSSKRLQKLDVKVWQLEKDFKRLHLLYTQIVLSESFYIDRIEKNVDMVPFDSNVTCSYCRCNIFNRFLTCQHCVRKAVDGDEDTYDVCLECYAMGRSCLCISNLTWCEQWDWGELTQKHEQWRLQIIQFEGKVDDRSPKSLKHELEKLAKTRTLAQICQTELLKRPFTDISKPSVATAAGQDTEIENEVDVNGNVKKKKVKKKSAKFVREHARCHIDCHWEPKWKQAHCMTCQKNWCYGVLFRAYDEMPQEIMKNPEWSCPSCRRICGCRHCKTRLGYEQYTPKGTMLGHNTKLVADDRSTESLVDFSFSNISWIQKGGDDIDTADTRRMRNRRREAAAAKEQAPQLGDQYVDVLHDSEAAGILRLAAQEGIPIDPSLGAETTCIEDSVDEDVVRENPEEIEKSSDDGRSSQLQFSLPEGGMLQDLRYAYKDTEAITYTYPDPVTAPPAQTPGQDHRQAYQEAAYSSVDHAITGTHGAIEMTERKRKRPTKVDDGDRPYQAKTTITKRTSKARLSLVVKLSINKDKLQEVDRMASIAQSALDATISAPVLGSDLQALNVHQPIVEGQPVTKRARTERDAEEEVDTEYAPGRARDRRRAPTDVAHLPVADADITRRTTRMQQTRYEEPDEEEFDEFVQPELPSKLDTMQDAAKIVDSIEVVDDSTSSDGSEVEELVRDVHPKVAGKRPQLTVPSISNAASSHARQSRMDQLKQTGTDGGADPIPTSTGSPVVSLAARSKIAVEAQANRRAKMAAVDMVEKELDIVSDAWSVDDDDDASTPSGSSRQSQNTTPPPVKEPAISKSTSKQRHNPPASMITAANRDSLSSTSTFLQPSAISPSQTVSKQMASADAWDDSDSDDDIARQHKPTLTSSNSWRSVNAIHSHTLSTSAGRERSTSSTGRGTGRGRGRPRGRPRYK